MTLPIAAAWFACNFVPAQHSALVLIKTAVVKSDAWWSFVANERRHGVRAAALAHDPALNGCAIGQSAKPCTVFDRATATHTSSHTCTCSYVKRDPASQPQHCSKFKLSRALTQRLRRLAHRLRKRPSLRFQRRSKWQRGRRQEAALRELPPCS